MEWGRGEEIRGRMEVSRLGDPRLISLFVSLSLCVCACVYLLTTPRLTRSPDGFLPKSPSPRGPLPLLPPGPPLPPSQQLRPLEVLGLHPHPRCHPHHWAPPSQLSALPWVPAAAPPAPPGFSGPVSSPQVRGCDPLNCRSAFVSLFSSDSRSLYELPWSPELLVLAGLWSL